MEKTLKINVPEGYEIDREKSTFENIVFKKKDDTIRWNATTYSVEIKADGEHFMVDASRPSYYCSWDDAMRFHQSSIWGLPTVKQLKVLVKHIDEVNKIIREHNGFELDGWMWSCEEKDKFCAWRVVMNDGYTSYSIKSSYHYVRAVSVL